MLNHYLIGVAGSEMFCLTFCPGSALLAYLGVKQNWPAEQVSSQPALLPDFTVFDCNLLKTDLDTQKLFAFQLYGMWRALFDYPPITCPSDSVESCLRGIGDDSFAAYSQFFTHSFGKK
jgi:hypothetical protein